jgi:hypothetical protein
MSTTWRLDAMRAGRSATLPLLPFLIIRCDLQVPGELLQGAASAQALKPVPMIDRPRGVLRARASLAAALSVSESMTADPPIAAYGTSTAA